MEAFRRLLTLPQKIDLFAYFNLASLIWLCAMTYVGHQYGVTPFYKCISVWCLARESYLSIKFSDFRIVLFSICILSPFVKGMWHMSQPCTAMLQWSEWMSIVTQLCAFVYGGTGSFFVKFASPTGRPLHVRAISWYAFTVFRYGLRIWYNHVESCL